MESEQTDPTPQPPIKSLTNTGTTDAGAAVIKPHEKVVQATNNQSAPGPYQHLLGFAIGYAVVLFFCAVGLGNSFAPLFPLIAGVYSTVLLTAMWSVFGPGNYLKRLFWAHLLGAIPGLALSLGALLLSISNWSLTREIWFGLVIILMSIVPVSLGAQLPFWFLRGLFGWQLVFRGQQPERSFNLREAFVLTFLFAFCFAIPQMSAKLQSRMMEPYNFNDEQGMTVTEMVVQPDGSHVPVDRVLTAEDLAARREVYERENQMESYASYGGSVLMVFMVALLSVPIVLFVFRAKKPASACALTGLYLFFVWLIPIVIGTIAFNGTGGEPEVFLYAGLLLSLCAGGVAVPLLVTRETGFQLTSPARFAREQRGG